MKILIFRCITVTILSDTIDTIQFYRLSFYKTFYTISFIYIFAYAKS